MKKAGSYKDLFLCGKRLKIFFIPILKKDQTPHQILEFKVHVFVWNSSWEFPYKDSMLLKPDQLDIEECFIGEWQSRSHMANTLFAVSYVIIVHAQSFSERSFKILPGSLFSGSKSFFSKAKRKKKLDKKCSL